MARRRTTRRCWQPARRPSPSSPLCSRAFSRASPAARRALEPSAAAPKEHPVSESHIDALARTIWDYHHVGHSLKEADCILVLGSHDLRVAERGARLLLEGWAPWLVLSGGLGRLTEGLWARSEAEQFAETALNMGVPKEKILIENRSTNTSENIRFSRELLRAQQLEPQTIIAVQKPYMERRTLAT